LPAPVRIAVVLSGSGTTLQNLLDRIDRGTLPARVVLVVSSVAGAFGLERARRAGVPAALVERAAFPDRGAFSEALARSLDAAAPDLVVFAGFIHRWILPDAYENRVMNVHPALVPAFSGKGYYFDRVHREALARGVKVSGCTVHFVNARFDEGPIILQAVVEVRDDDTVDTLRERVQAAEREAYPEAIRLFAEGRLRVEGRRVRILPAGSGG
jgi:formyltetrahydrofolate-dependent phosphoribosylglycinamide formyltransferase